MTAAALMSADGARELPVGEVGELWVRGPVIVKGYWTNPQATAQTFIAGWLRVLGEAPGAVVQLKPGATATEEELRAWVASRLAAFKVPVRVLLRRHMLPRNAAGKILKIELQDAFNSLTYL